MKNRIKRQKVIIFQSKTHPMEKVREFQIFATLR